MGMLIRISFIISILIFIFSILGFFVLKFFPHLTANVSSLIPFFIKFGAIGFTLSTIICSFIISVNCFGFFRTLLLFSISFITSLTMELSSTYNGFPFGNYKYTDFLGYKILNEVPIIIPLSWFSIVSLSYLIAKRLLFNGFSLIIVSTLFGFFWDLSLDFAMTKTYPFWYWIDKGFLYDMPIRNWGGWLFTLFIINFVFYVLSGNSSERYSKYVFYLYLLIVGFSVLMSLLGGGIVPFVFGVLGILIIISISMIRNVKLW